MTTGERTVVASGGADGRYLPTGHVVYAFEDGLYGIAFDAGTLTVTGGAVPLLQGVRRAAGQNNAAAQFAVADDGTLVYISGSAAVGGQRTLVWVDRDGREELVEVGNRNFAYVRISPDGGRIATTIAEEGSPSSWTTDAARPVLSHVSSAIQAPSSQTWSADGRRVIFTTESEGGRSLSWTLADGTGEIETLVTLDGVPFISAGGRTPDGREMLFTYGTGSAQPSIGMLSLEPNDDGEHEWRPLIERATGASAASVSPNGEWVAYHTDDTGQYGVYIERFPELGDRRLISDSDGGWGARWSPNGDEIFYRRLGDGAMMSVPVELSADVELGTPELLFENQGYWPPVTPSAGGGSSLNWDLAPDGRFLMIKAGGGTQGTSEIIVVQNWFEELERLVPTE